MSELKVKQHPLKNSDTFDAQPAFAIRVPVVVFEYLFIRKRKYKIINLIKLIIINRLCGLVKNNMNNYVACAPGMQKKC